MSVHLALANTSLGAALRAHGLACKEVDLDDAAAPSRGLWWVDDAVGVVRDLEEAGQRVVNGSRAMQLEQDKLLQLRVLARATPQTVAVPGWARLREAVEAWPYGFPLVLRPNRGGAARLVPSLESALALVEEGAEESEDGITLLQQYVHSIDSCLYRLQFVGGKFVYAEQVDTSSFTGGSRARAAPRIQSFSHHVLATLGPALLEAKVDVGAVDVVVDELGVAYALSVRCTSSYDPVAEAQAGLAGRGAAEVAAFLGDVLREIA